MPKIVSLVGGRPQFIKEAMVYRAVKRANAWDHVLVHSGQHYDWNMSGSLFDELSIKTPDYFLKVGSGTHGAMTAAVLERFEKVLMEEKPDLVLVYGDMNTTVSGALAAAKLKIPVAHVEAGQRQDPRDMPEEINRVLTDHMSKYLFAPSKTACENLLKEGIREGIYEVGDVMYDLYLAMKPKFNKELRSSLGLEAGGYVLTTIHRDFNADDEKNLTEILKGLLDLSKELSVPVVFPVHPRTRNRIKQFGLEDMAKGLKLLDPVSYLDLMGLSEESLFVVTDSGGFQKEAVFGGKRALVVMEATGWPELVEAGWNCLCPPKAPVISELGLKMAREPMENPPKPYGDGCASEKIVKTLKDSFGPRGE